MKKQYGCNEAIFRILRVAFVKLVAKPLSTQETPFILSIFHIQESGEL